MTVAPETVFNDSAMNALNKAIYDCAADNEESNGRPRPQSGDRYDVYNYLSQTPRTSLVAELVEKLRENGFDIKRK